MEEVLRDKNNTEILMMTAFDKKIHASHDDDSLIVDYH